MSTSLSQDLRCPRCSAHVRAGSQWCTLCYADLRPAPAVPREPAPTPELAAASVEPPGVETAADSEPEQMPVRRGKHARAAAEPGALDIEGTAAAMLAELAAAESGNRVGQWSALLDSPGKKVGLMVGGAVAAMVLIFLLMSAAGALL
ncbi:MAG TPA: hypothetical protein VFV76_09360 [Actinomycetes bacterium]|nr:hypothetical protein [Actinomycetes bacterium]